ncbi:hypothetical protein Tco_0733027 [Tanacetum coccineum]
MNCQLLEVYDVEPQSPEVASQSLGKAPPSPDYVLGLEHPPSSDYVSGPEYPEYVAQSDDDIPVEDRSLPADASPITLSPGYVVDLDLEEDPKEDPVDEGDDDEEEEDSSKDDDDKEKEDASEEDKDEEEEHLAPADSATATPPRSPRTKVPFSQTHLRMAQKTVTDIALKDKNEAKWTKPNTGMERVQEIEAEGEFILSLNQI